MVCGLTKQPWTGPSKRPELKWDREGVPTTWPHRSALRTRSPVVSGVRTRRPRTRWCVLIVPNWSVRSARRKISMRTCHSCKWDSAGTINQKKYLKNARMKIKIKDFKLFILLCGETYCINKCFFSAKFLIPKLSLVKNRCK